jgi:hypothetical protein
MLGALKSDERMALAHLLRKSIEGQAANAASNAS